MNRPGRSSPLALPGVEKLPGQRTELIGIHSRLNRPAVSFQFEFLGRCQLDAIRHEGPQETAPFIAGPFTSVRLECNRSKRSVS